MLMDGEKHEEQSSSEGDLGKLKRTLKQKCPCCGKNLQLRSRKRLDIQRGEEIIKYEDYIVCPSCEYEEEVEEKRSRRKQKGEGDFIGGY